MKLGVIILARANYGRWPDKVLYRLQGKTILEHVIRKALLLDVDTVIVSTTESQEDQVIRDISWDSGACISRGEPNDRTLRYYKAIQEYDLDYIMTITPSAPFFDVEYTNRLIKAFKDNPYYDFYYSGIHSEFTPRISRASLVSDALENPDRDEEIFNNYDNINKVFQLYNWYDPELKNRYLFNGNIAYRIQADNHRRICEYLGHFPESYDEVVRALMGMR